MRIDFRFYLPERMVERTAREDYSTKMDLWIAKDFD